MLFHHHQLQHENMGTCEHANTRIPRLTLLIFSLSTHLHHHRPLHRLFRYLFIFTANCNITWLYRYHCRTMIKAKLFDLPMYGPAVGTRCGSFPVHYSSNSSGNFKTDPEKQKKVMEDIQKHIDASGCIAICPEGQVAETPPNMQPFRRGAFGVPIKYEMPIWGLTMHGCWKGWPKAASIGGDPATITVSLDYLMTPKADATTTDVAAECQEKMQARMDAIIASLGEKKAE